MDDLYTQNYNRLSSATQGGAPKTQIMWVAAFLTIFDLVASWINPNNPKVMQLDEHK